VTWCKVKRLLMGEYEGKKKKTRATDVKKKKSKKKKA